MYCGSKVALTVLLCNEGRRIVNLSVPMEIFQNAQPPVVQTATYDDDDDADDEGGGAQYKRKLAIHVSFKFLIRSRR